MHYFPQDFDLTGKASISFFIKRVAKAYNLSTDFDAVIFGKGKEIHHIWKKMRFLFWNIKRARCDRSADCLMHPNRFMVLHGK